MKTKVLFVALLAMLFAVFLTPSTVNASYSYQVPDDILESSYFKVSPDPNGPSVVISIHNTDDDPVWVDFRLLNTEGHTLQNWFFEMNPHEIYPVTLRDIIDPALYTDGLLEAGIEVVADREVLTGEIILINGSTFRSDGDLLKTRGVQCVDRCEKYYLRYLRGGAFDGGTEIDIKHTAGFYDTKSVDFQFFNEAGEFTDHLTLQDVPVFSQTRVSDLNLTDNFGGVYITPPGDNEPVIEGSYIGFQRFSTKWRAVCIPVCDPTNPMGSCYVGTCNRPNLTVLAGGSTACQIGVPFSATLRATGTHLEPITCNEPLPDGVTFNQATSTLSAPDGCQNMNIPSITCSVHGECGQDTKVFPVIPEDTEYGITVTKVIQEKGCLQSGQTEAFAIFNVIVTNTSTTAITVDISDPSAPECNRENQAIGEGATYTATCTTSYPIGHHENTAYVTVDGTTIEVSSTAEFDINNCPLACEGVPQPTFSLDLLSQTNATATTRSILSYSGTGVSGSINFQAPTLPIPGGFMGGNVVANANNDSIFQKTASVQTVIANWSVSRNGEMCYSNSAQLTIQPQAGCDAYPEPAITLTEESVLTATHKIVNIVPNPAGGTFNRAVPVSIPRPLYGEPEGSETFLYSYPYTPTGTTLSCTATKDIVVTIPPRDPQCSDFPVDVIEGTPVTSQTSTTFTVESLPYTTNPNTAGTMNWSPNPPQTYNRPPFGQPAGSASFTGVFTYNPAPGLTCTAPAAKTVSIPPRDPQCSDFPVDVIEGTPVTSQTSTQFTVQSLPYTTSPNTAGTMVWTPNPPQTYTRPPFGQPAGSASFTGVFTYNPAAGLTCTAPAAKTVSIPPQEPDCDDFPVDVIEGTPVTSQTSTTFTVESLPYTTSPNTTGTMVWTPNPPQTYNRPPFGQPAGSQTFNGVFTYTPATGLTCTAPAQKVVSIPPQTASCADYPTTVTPGTPVTSQTSTTFTVSSIPYTTNPSRTGTMVWTPSLPDTRNRPPYGQTASQTYNGVFTYTPVTGLTCTANASKTVTIPPQDCATSNPPTGDLTWNTSGNPLTGNATVANAGTFHLYIYATSTQTECNNRTYDNEKVHQQVTKTCGQTGTLSGSYNWAGHDAEWWRVVLKLGTTIIEESPCLRNDENLTMYDEEELFIQKLQQESEQ